MMAPLVVHKDPYFLSVLEDTADLLREVFLTTNRATLALPATGGSGMEAALSGSKGPRRTSLAAGAFVCLLVRIRPEVPPWTRPGAPLWTRPGAPLWTRPGVPPWT